MLDQGKTEEAADEWERALQEAPQDADSLAGKALAMYALGRRAEAEWLYRHAVGINKRYLDRPFLQNEALLSPRAMESARPLIESITASQR